MNHQRNSSDVIHAILKDRLENIKIKKAFVWGDNIFNLPGIDLSKTYSIKGAMMYEAKEYIRDAQVIYIDLLSSTESGNTSNIYDTIAHTSKYETNIYITCLYTEDDEYGRETLRYIESRRYKRKHSLFSLKKFKEAIYPRSFSVVVEKLDSSYICLFYSDDQHR